MKLISSSYYQAINERGVDRFYKPVFLHEGSTLSADSSDYNPSERFFDAYGNVVITQPNGTVVYADKLHYIKDDRVAILTNNVRMVDVKGAVLTTNHLTYNLNSKIGTYTNGGRIVNEKDTLNSKNGYYFENSQDAYFRYNVIVRTPETTIFTDTLRYNSVSKMAYFYGPTNIKGRNGGNLYTENGDYHTETDRARFGKNNLYTEGSKFLRGDSLYYDGKQGYGRAIKNVVFIDTAQQGILYGQKGVYLKKDESITMTDSAYMIMVTKKDSVQNKGTADSLTTDSLPPTRSLDSLTTDSLHRPVQDSSATDSVYMAADTLYSRVILLKDYIPVALNLQRDGGDLDEDDEEQYNDLGTDSLENSLSDSLATVLPDSIQQIPDSTALDSTGQAIKKEKINPETAEKSVSADSLTAPPKPKHDTVPPLDIPADSIMKVNQQDTLQKQLLKEPSQETIKKAVSKASKLQSDTLVQSQRAWIGDELAADSLLINPANTPLKGQADSSFTRAKQAALNRTPSDSSSLDTTKTRIVKAYYHMRIYKSDLQARADSAYYGYPDSVMRCYGNPMIWAQGSQLSSDTLYMQLKNQKLDNMLLKTNAFIVSTQLDSAKFNQIKGRKITGFFTDNQLDVMYVDGNAESIYYTLEANKISGMTKSVGGRIKILFDNNEVASIVNIRKTETSYTPVAAFDPDKEILPGFIWKPKDRPKSKEEIINPPFIAKDTTSRLTDTLQQTPQDSLKRDSLKKTASPAKKSDKKENPPIKEQPGQPSNQEPAKAILSRHRKPVVDTKNDTDTLVKKQ
ncbi:hypothetical protein GCM10023231_09750 [Olivibacter ginsenosidimutans]|uniref:Organic solvent tolerance-like N-terminal domain-containing protein n=1 Tax=Olivibacter ginsenosidimutans TaxID=1176537 RepID=A0ABP9AR24_9SPHI